MTMVGPFTGPLSAEHAGQLDRDDPLAAFRQRFVIDDPDLIYLDGNSLGRLPKATAEVVQRVVDREWGQRLIRGWNESWWLKLQQRIGDKIGRLIGASAGETIVADSTSLNLFKVVLAGLQAKPERKKIVTDDLNFPSDLYILNSACRLLGSQYHVEVIPSPDGVHGPVEAIQDALDGDTALLALSHTAFKSAYVYDLPFMTERAHSAGALALWDLSHSAGAVLVGLDDGQADLAVGCSYKYLNGGPGSLAFLYVRHNLQADLQNPITGWIGHQSPFDFELSYRAADGLAGFLTGTPAVLSIASIEPGVDLLLEAGIEEVRAKSMRQSEYLIRLWEAFLAPLGYTLNSPAAAARRGSHISLGHPQGWGIDRALIEELNVIPDFRQPDNIRLGIAPLYTTFSEIFEAVQRLCTAVVEKRYLKYDRAAEEVT